MNFAAVWRSFDQLLEGLLLSLGLAVGAILAGFVIGLVVAFALVSKAMWLRRPAGVYVTVIRNTPILVLVLFSYFALPELGLRRQARFHCCLLLCGQVLDWLRPALLIQPRR